MLFTNSKTSYIQASLNDAYDQLPMKSAIKIVANHMFDKAFPSWNGDLSYNADFYLIGNYCVGTELLAICNSLYKTCVEHGYKRVIFLSRDGYLPKKAFDIFLKERNIKGIATDYFYVSRRAVLPLLILKKKTLGVIRDFVSPHQHTPESLIKKFILCLNF